MSKEAMKLALEFVEANHVGGPDAFELINTLKQALEQPEQEPLATPLPCDVKVGHVTIRKGVALSVLVARMQVLYDMAQAPQRKPLTDDEIADLWRAQIFHIVDLKLAKDFVRDIEAAHGITGEQK